MITNNVQNHQSLGEMQIKTTMGKRFTPTTMATIKKYKPRQEWFVGEEVDKLQPSCIMKL